jgi:hypothetical protein
VAHVRHLDVPFGYPVYTPERPRIMSRIHSYLAHHDIRSFGRFGAWDYANSDECIRQGMELGRLLSRHASGDAK